MNFYIEFIFLFGNSPPSPALRRDLFCSVNDLSTSLGGMLKEKIYCLVLGLISGLCFAEWTYNKHVTYNKGQSRITRAMKTLSGTGDGEKEACVREE